MPDFIKNPRFILSFLLLAIAGAALLTGRITWDVFAAGATGFLIRFAGGGAADKVVDVAKSVKVPPASILLLLALPLMIGCGGLTTQQKGVVTGVGTMVAKTGINFGEAKGLEWCTKQHKSHKDDDLLKLCKDLVGIAKTATDWGVKKGLKSIPVTSSTPAPIEETEKKPEG